MNAGTLVDLERCFSQAPTICGRSKKVYRLDDLCVVRVVPSLRSYTFARDELIPGTEVLRLDFFELAARELSRAGIRGAFMQRLAPDAYLAEYCIENPFEVIVKNVATGSTTRKYPGLFPEGHQFRQPVVKFDFRTDPEDQAIADDYVREYGVDPGAMRSVALHVNDTLRRWLKPRVLVDFCIVIGTNTRGEYVVTSEISPDAMRLRSPDGQSLDKDLFRCGESAATILRSWAALVADLKPSPAIADAGAAGEPRPIQPPSREIDRPGTDTLAAQALQ